MPITLDDLRHYSIARTFFKPTTLLRAITKLGFVQADPIRAPARAQDLILRHRVKSYRAGDLEKRYPQLPIEEDFFVNYGFLPSDVHALMLPRTARQAWTRERWKQADEVLNFVRQRGAVHPREVDAYFSHGRVTNWFGGSSNASTQLLDGMHYRGLLRIARRDSGVRVYERRPLMPAPVDDVECLARYDALVDHAVTTYAPLPARTLGQLLSHLSGGVPQWRHFRANALKRVKARLASTRIDGVDWYWPADEKIRSHRVSTEPVLRLLAPFDPLVWDRHRFEAFWGWSYRFEAYTPANRRKLGYYALPLLWRDDVVGWANLGLSEKTLQAELGFAKRNPMRDAGFKPALQVELNAMARFLGLNDGAFALRTH